MSRTTAALAFAAFVLACVGAFLAGGEVKAHGRATAHSLPGSAAAVASAPANDRRTEAYANASAAHSWPSSDLRRSVALSTEAGSYVAQAAPPNAYVETADQRVERHRAIDRHLTERLGPISAEKRAALLELNDEATQVQMGMQAEVMAGTLSQADYDAEIRQRIVVQLDQLHAQVTDDEYRKLTGLEPGVDPYEYMRTGIGAAPGVPAGPEP